MAEHLYLLSKERLDEFLAVKRDLFEQFKGMSAEEIKELSQSLIMSAQVNMVPPTGNIKLSVDENGVATIPVVGMLTNTIDIFSVIFGESITTYDFITEATAQADQNPKISHIKYLFETPGGVVPGVEQASNAIFNAKTPTSSEIGSSAQSAGYWLASQTDNIESQGRTSILGSVGVAVIYNDKSKLMDDIGVKQHVLTSTDAPNKRVDPTTDEGKKVVIQELDEVHQVFVDHIARGRKLTPKFINENFGRGGSMAADRALENKMIDSIAGQSKPNRARRRTANVNQNGANAMNEQQFLAFLEENPEAKAAYDTITAASRVDFEKITLAEVLEKAPEAKAQHEQALADARTEVESDNLTAEQTKFVATVIGSANYDNTLKASGVKVLTNEKDFGHFEDLVAQEDRFNEKIKSLKVQKDQPAGTQAEQHDVKAADKTMAEAKAQGQKQGTYRKEV